MRLQNAAIMRMLEQLDTELSGARRTGTVQEELKRNLEFAKNLADRELLAAKVADKARNVHAQSVILRSLGLAQGSA